VEELNLFFVKMIAARRLFSTSCRILFCERPPESAYYDHYKNSYQEHVKSFSHVDESGEATMVNVGDKEISKRNAKAKVNVLVGPEVFRLIRSNQIKKGDVLTVAKIAGIMGAKKTSDLIPLCHPLALTKVDVKCYLEEYESKVVVECEAHCVSQTGVEMEALTGASVAALTIYDMCKAVNKAISISDLHLLEKSGGKSGSYKL